VTEKERFGKYEIIRKLGGGMSDVYLARDLVLGRPVVLKIIKNSDDVSTQLVIEAEKRGVRIQRQLAGCERILEVYESGEQDGSFFAVLEYYPGRTLAEILGAERRLDPKRAARYTAEICSQLRILHGFVSQEDARKTAVVHGDIKPSNIQIGANDQLRILDFGIAKFITSGRDLTRHQLGSPGYCSPERLRDSHVDIHADIWATGVCLYEMLAGSPPFEAQDTRKLEDLIKSRKPMAALPDDCPAEMAQIVAKALARDLSCRYSSAEAFEADLLAFLENRVTQAAQERLQNGKANATIFRRPAMLAPKFADAIPRRRVRVRFIKNAPQDVTNLAIALLAGVLCGLVLFVPATRYFQVREIRRSLAQRKDYVLLPASVLAADWQNYQTAKHRGFWWPQLSHNDDIEDGLRANLLDSANNLIGRFRRSSDDEPANFDWSRARLCLLYALEIDSLNTRARGQLHLCDGYLSLEDAHRSTVSYAIEAFRRASALMPRSPDPHLGLARAYVYGVRNVGMALAEFHHAAQLGYTLGPREREQEADGYLTRAEAELNFAKRAPLDAKQDAARWLRLARGDMERAQNLYEPITGFSHVEVSLEQVYRDQEDQAKLEQALFTPAPKPHLILLKARFVKRPVSFTWR
jgi:eukaryotic-like serine/threonine-protein kinase